MDLTNGTVDSNGSILYPTDYKLTNKDFEECLNYYNINVNKKLVAKMDEYKGNTAAFKNVTAGALGTESAKGAVNFPKTLVDSFNGYFIGTPVTITMNDDRKNDDFQSWLTNTSFSDKLAELSKQTSIYGKSYLLAYNDEDSHLKVGEVSPERAFMIYDDGIEHSPLAFVMYNLNNQNEMVGHIYTDGYDITFSYSGGLKVVGTKSIVFGGAVPAIEFYDNVERMGVFDPVIDLVYLYDKALSAKSDDNDYFAHAYLFLKNFQLDEEQQLNVKDSRLIATSNDNLGNIDVDAKFLEKPDADQLQEHLLDRLEDLIYKTSSIANINDSTFGNSTSGTSLAYKLQPMSNLALNKERKFTEKLREMFKMLQIQLGIDYSQLSFRFIRNVPNIVSTEASVAQKLMGVTSHETALSTLSIVSNPREELQKITDEQKQQIQAGITSSSSSSYDFDNTSEDKTTDDNVEESTDE